MPCPFFEPLRIESAVRTGRLPLIDEYDGRCHAGSESAPVADNARFRWCNHGNSNGCCQRFPAQETRSCLRYEVLQRDAAHLSILCIEEQSYAPLRWYAVQYSCTDNLLMPEPQDCCVRSQIVAFCRSYLAHFPISKVNE
jgi:hypothetical protein